jgi:hypothetical protein
MRTGNVPDSHGVGFEQPLGALPFVIVCRLPVFRIVRLRAGDSEGTLFIREIGGRVGTQDRLHFATLASKPAGLAVFDPVVFRG